MSWRMRLSADLRWRCLRAPSGTREKCLKTPKAQAAQTLILFGTSRNAHGQQERSRPVEIAVGSAKIVSGGEKDTPDLVARPMLNGLKS